LYFSDQIKCDDILSGGGDVVCIQGCKNDEKFWTVIDTKQNLGP